MLDALLLAANLSLPQAIDAALQNNPEYRSAAMSVRIAEDRVRVVRSSLALSATVEDRLQTQSPVAMLSTPFGPLPFSPNTTNVPIIVAQYSLLDGPAAERVAQANANLAAAVAGEHEARGVVIAQVSRRYYDAVAAQQSENVARYAQDVARQHEADAQKRYFIGLVPRAEVLQAQTDLAERQVDEIDARNAVEIAVSSLDAAMNVPLSSTYTLEQAFETPDPPMGLTALIASADATRGEIAAAQQAIDAARYSLRAAHASSLPIVQVSVSEGNVQPAVMSGFHAQFTAALSAVWHILDGGQTAAEADSAQASLEQAQLTLDTLKTSTELAVRQAYVNVLAARQRALATQRAVALADENRRLAEVRYRGGVGTSLELRDADLRDFNARRQVVAAQASLARSTVDLRFAAGLL